MPNNLWSWMFFLFFFVGSLGGVVYFIRLMFWKEGRTEVHHRYVQVPFYYGPPEFREPLPFPGRAGDMAQNEAKEEASGSAG